MEAYPVAYYVGCALGIGLAWLFLRFFTLFRFFMTLLFAAGAVVSAFAGLLLTMPLENILPLWAGPCAGLFFWCVAVGSGWPARNQLSSCRCS